MISKKMILKNATALFLSLCMGLSLFACGDKSKEQGGTSSEKGETDGKGEEGEKSKEASIDLAEVENFLKEKRPDDFSGSGFASLVETPWKDDELFDEIVQVSGLGGLETYPGSASSALTLVKAKVENDWGAYAIETNAYVALNKKGKIVLSWLEAEQDIVLEESLSNVTLDRTEIDAKDKTKAEGEETKAQESASPEQKAQESAAPETTQENAENADQSTQSDQGQPNKPSKLRAVMMVNAELLALGMRLNEKRVENALPSIAFESLMGENVGDIAVDPNNLPQQNSAPGDPDNMSKEEAEQYNKTAEENQISEEKSESDE